MLKHNLFLCLITLLWWAAWVVLYILVENESLPQNRLTIAPMLAAITDSYIDHDQWHNDVTWMMFPAFILVMILGGVFLPLQLWFWKSKRTGKLVNITVVLQYILLAITLLPVVNYGHIVWKHWPSRIQMTVHVPSKYFVMDEVMNLSNPNEIDAFGFRPIDATIYHCHVDGAKILLDLGAKVNGPNHRHYSALMEAARNYVTAKDAQRKTDCLTIVQLLINKGADVDYLYNLESVLDFALYQSHFLQDTTLIETILPYTNQLNELIYKKDREGQPQKTLLINAIEYRDVPLVELLLASGANPNTPDAKGISPIEYAYRPIHNSITFTLADKGIIISAGDERSIRKLLTDAGAVSSKNPLHPKLL